jgi:signal transduction histidine kinase
MIGTSLACSAGMVKTTTIEELMGIKEDELPDFSGMILRSEAGGDNGSTFAHEADKVAVWKNLKPYYTALHTSGFTPVLLELAVIQDPRLIEERRQLIREANIDTFFVSDVVSFGNAGKRALLCAWDLAIQRMLDTEVHHSPVPIVTNKNTYAKALYYVDMSQPIAEVEQATKASGLSALHSSWVEQEVIEGQHNKAATNGNNSHIAGLDEEAYAEKRSELRRKYTFAWEDIPAQPVESVRYLSRGFLYYLFQDCVDVERNNGIDTLSQLKQAVSESHLLVIPFRRPRVAGTIGSDALLPGHDNAEPGGCFFALIRPTPGVDEERNIDARICELSIRLNWLLARSALAEAFSEIALKQDKDYILSIATHHLPSELRELKGNVGLSRDELSTKSALSESDKRALDYMQSALQTATRLESTAEFLNKAQKSRDSGRAQCTFMVRLSQHDLVSKLNLLLKDAWKEAKEPFLNSQRHAGAELDQSQVRLENLKLPARASIATDLTVIRFVILELLKNALRHGVFPDERGVCASIKIVETKDDNYVEVDISNAISNAGKIQTINLIRKRPWRIGLASLEGFSQAYGVPGPQFVPSQEEARISMQMVVGIVQG